MGATIGDGSVPVYRFEWDDGSSRQTDGDGMPDEVSTASVETLAELGRRDPECDVELVRFN